MCSGLIRFWCDQSYSIWSGLFHIRDVTRPQPHEAEAEATTHEAEAEAEATTHEAEAEATTHEAEAEAEAEAKATTHEPDTIPI